MTDATPMTPSEELKARELLAAEYVADGCHREAGSILAGVTVRHQKRALRAITKALTPSRGWGHDTLEIVEVGYAIATVAALALATIPPPPEEERGDG